MWKKEMSRLLDERAERIVALEQRLEKSSTIIETYRAREQTILDSLTSSQAEARQRIADAEAKADELIGNARVTAENATQAAEASANEIVTRAEKYRDELLHSAEAQADEMLSNAREKSSSMLAQAQAAVAEYQETLERYNAIIEESAAHAKMRAEQYAAFLSTQALSAPEFAKTAENLSEAPYVAPVVLPEVEDNPAQLMRNIYTLEKRVIPEEAAERPAHPMPSAEPGEPLPAVQQVTQEPEEMPDLAPHPAEEPKTQAEPVLAVQQITEEPEEMPDLAPHPVEEPEETPDLATYPAAEPVFAVSRTAEEPEEIPDLAPRPEPAEWRPEDEAAEPEWQPEADEPEMPTVRELTGEHPVDDDVEMSLDALLDEIIHAGD